MTQMFPCRYGDRDRLRHKQAKNMLSVMGYLGLVAPAPLLVDFIFVHNVPVGQLVAAGIQPGLLGHFPHRRLHECFTFVLAARNRLPIAGMVRPFEQQDLHVRRMDNYQNGNWNLVDSHHHAPRVGTESENLRFRKNGFPNLHASPLPPRTLALYPQDYTWRSLM